MEMGFVMAPLSSWLTSICISASSSSARKASSVPSMVRTSPVGSVTWNTSASGR